MHHAKGAVSARGGTKMLKAVQLKELRLLSKVSRLYYEQGLTEQVIADKLNLSRSKVSRLLKQARAQGIVRISVFSPPNVYADLEDQLERKFGLREAVVVEVTEPESREIVAREIGGAAAFYFQQTLSEGSTVGVCWGNTLRAMVASLQPQKTANTQIVQIIGGLGPPTAESHAVDLCRRMASVLYCGLTLLPAPGITENRQTKEAILADSHVQAALQLIPQLNVAYVGIGVPTPDSLYMRDGTIVRPEEVAELRSQGAVGDIALRFFDAGGRPVRSDLDERVIGIGLDQLKQIPRVVGVAGGPGKEDAIRGAVLGGYINVLVTDQVTAASLLQS